MDEFYNFYISEGPDENPQSKSTDALQKSSQYSQKSGADSLGVIYENENEDSQKHHSNFTYTNSSINNEQSNSGLNSALNQNSYQQIMVADRSQQGKINESGRNVDQIDEEDSVVSEDISNVTNYQTGKEKEMQVIEKAFLKKILTKKRELADEFELKTNIEKEFGFHCSGIDQSTGQIIRECAIRNQLINEMKEKRQH